MRLTNKWVLGAIAAGALAMFLAPALGGESPAPTLSLDGGTGMAGGTADVVISLSGDDAGAAVSAGVDVAFSTDELNIIEPVMTGCQIADRLSSTHSVGGRVLSPGLAAVEIFVLGTPDPLPPLGNGAIASCAFAIDSGAMIGDMYPVGATNVLLGDALGGEIASSAADGVVEIVGDPTVTPTDTATVAPTATATATPTATPECTDASQCPSGQDCVDGMCVPIDCTDDSDCPPGSDCVQPQLSGTVPTGVCQPRPCMEDEDCEDPRAVCDDNMMCRPQFCTDPSMCDPGEVCEDDGICAPECESDSDCPDGVCLGNTCVECRENSDCDAGEECRDNACVPGNGGGFGVAVGSASGEAGSTVTVSVTLTGDGASAADSVSNTLRVGSGLGLTACNAVSGIAATFDGLPGTTASAQVGDGEASVPVGIMYECSVEIGAEAAGTIPVDCPSASVNGSAVTCTAGGVQVLAPPTPTFTMIPTATFTFTPIPTDTPAPPLGSGDDDGCAVGPVSQTANPFGSSMLLLVPAILLWSRRRA